MLKRELRETENRLAQLERDLGQAELQAAALNRTIEDLSAQLEARSEERRQAERDAANQGAALKQMEGEAQRMLSGACRSGLCKHLGTRKRARPSTPSSSRSAKKPSGSKPSARPPKRHFDEQQSRLVGLRQQREKLQQDAARLTAELAGLEERRRGAEAAFQRINRLHADLESGAC